MAAAGNSNVKEIKDDNQFKRELTMALEKLVVVDFFATWYESTHLITMCLLRP